MLFILFKYFYGFFFRILISFYFVFEFDFPPIFKKRITDVSFRIWFWQFLKFIFSLTVMKYRAKPKNITIISKMTWWSSVWGKRGKSEWTRESWNYWQSLYPMTWLRMLWRTTRHFVQCRGSPRKLNTVEGWWQLIQWLVRIAWSRFRSQRTWDHRARQ